MAVPMLRRLAKRLRFPGTGARCQSGSVRCALPTTSAPEKSRGAASGLSRNTKKPGATAIDAVSISMRPLPIGSAANGITPRSNTGTTTSVSITFDSSAS